MTDLGSLTRRYIVIGAIDGTLTIVAIVLATLASALLLNIHINVSDVNLLIRAGLSAGVGLAIPTSSSSSSKS